MEFILSEQYFHTTDWCLGWAFARWLSISCSRAVVFWADFSCCFINSAIFHYIDLLLHLISCDLRSKRWFAYFWEFLGILSFWSFESFFVLMKFELLELFCFLSFWAFGAFVLSAVSCQLSVFWMSTVKLVFDVLILLIYHVHCVVDSQSIRRCWTVIKCFVVFYR